MSTTPKPKFTREHIALATGSALDHIAESYSVIRYCYNTQFNDYETDAELRARIMNKFNQAETEQDLKDRFGHVSRDMAKGFFDTPRLDQPSVKYARHKMTRDDFNDLYLCHPNTDQSRITPAGREELTAAQINLDVDLLRQRMRHVREQDARSTAKEFGLFLAYVMSEVDPSVKLTASQVRMAEDLFIRVQSEGVKPWQF